MAIMTFMFTTASDIFKGLHDSLPRVVSDYGTLLGTISFVILALGIWRLCRFTIIPLFYPSDPKELPYWIPILGHLLAFFNRSDDLLTSARFYFENTREPYALTVAGMKTYVITKSEHVGQVYRNTHSLSYEEFVQAMMRILGNSEQSVQAMFTPLSKEKKGFPNPHGKPLGILFREMHIHQLFPGENLDFLDKRFHDFFDKHLRLDKLKQQCTYAISKAAGSIDLPLTQWCSDFLVKGGQDAYFGPRLTDIDRGLTDAFIIFDELSYQVIYQYPRFLAAKMLASRDRVLKGLEKYLQLPRQERSEDAWFVGAMEDEMRAIGMNAKDMSIASMTIYWAINTNNRKAAYWMLAYLVQNPVLMDIVRRETETAIRKDGTIDLRHLHSSVPQLDNMWKEMLRLSAFAASVRLITEDTVIGDKILRKGNRLIIPYRQLHMDETVYGESASQFRPERFAKTPGLTNNNNYRPFGGGATMCPGRHIARHAVYIFIAMVLNRFDLEVRGDQTTLEADLTRPVPGLMSPKVGQELRVRLTERRAKG
ncbi:cytochrome P450 [Nemania sp. FL0031]|nr:cytochrome P450 [Nemania sp. FL0031]